MKNDIQSENDDTEVKNKEKLETTLKTVEAKIIARADKVKAIEKTLEEFRVGKEKANRQKDRNKGINYTSSPLRYHVLYFHLDIYHSHFYFQYF